MDSSNDRGQDPEVYDVLIVGAGVTGVALARALSAKHPRLRVAVLEKEPEVARHTSGRNSGVLHPGFNPKPGTLKAHFCVEGNHRLREFCARRGVPHRTSGLLVVACTPEEEYTLEELLRRGRENGVPDLSLLTREELTQREPQVKGLAALYAPTGGIVDARALVRALTEEAARQGVRFHFSTAVRRIERVGQGRGFLVRTSRGAFRGEALVNCAGLHADRIAHGLGVGRDYAIIPFRGEYFRLRREKAEWVRCPVYPTPDLVYPFLGIHFTPTIGGELLVGPNAILALGREAYRKFQLMPRDLLGYLTDSRFWRLLRRELPPPVAWRYLKTSLSKRAFCQEAAALVEGIRPEDLVPGPPPGIRAQLVDREGHLVEDVVVERTPDGGTPSLHVLNVVSPGLTCALPFADWLVDLL